ncbi:BTAD domain-containing putative transcriptional regulator [Streptomyces sp. NPDC046557]|uniref:AfsR/SARP family transcriptional regulator n=1 Tax=Streptomyces sp. NPDC046557 TaxID=3155372 RepID=UPI0033C902E7
MEIQLLGEPRVTENGVLITAPTAEARHLLAALAASPDRVVPETVLADELAYRTSSPYHHAVLHTAVRRLRERLAEVLGARSVRTPESVLSARSGGYVLDTGGGRSDVREFEREAGAGYRAMSRGDFEQAARRLRRALALWTGPALDGIKVGPWLGARVTLLDADRRSVLEQWVEAELALGRGRELRLELAGLRGAGGGERLGGAFLDGVRRAEERVEAHCVTRFLSGSPVACGA